MTNSYYVLEGRLYKCAFIFAFIFVFLLSGCGVVGGGNMAGSVLVTSVPSSFVTTRTVQAGAAPVVLTALDASQNQQPVTWSLTLGNVSCTPDCGSLSASGSSSVNTTYTPPSTAPLNQSATITAVPLNNPGGTFVIDFTIGAGLSLSIQNKFTSQMVGGPSVPLSATVLNDSAKAGVTWTLTAGGANCSPACGTLQPGTSPTTTATYVPPTTLPTGGNASPLITAASVTNSHVTDSFSFSIVLPSVQVSITNKFASQFAGGLAIPLNATLVNDLLNAGVTWTLTAGGANCSPGCGTLQPGAAPTTTATYIPPATLPTGANLSPTVTAISVTNPAGKDSFSFSIQSATTLFSGNFSFLLRGFAVDGSPMAVAGVLSADGKGTITGGELDINIRGGITSAPSPLAGTYSVALPAGGAVHGSILLTDVHLPGQSMGLSFMLSSDGKRGKIIEVDGNDFRTVGTLQAQDATALAQRMPPAPTPSALIPMPPSMAALWKPDSSSSAPVASQAASLIWVPAPQRD